MQALGAAFIATWSSVISFTFCYIFNQIGRLRVNQIYEVIGFDNLLHTDYKDALKSEVLQDKKDSFQFQHLYNSWCFDPSKVKVSDFKCDSAIPIMNEDTKRALIMTLEYNVRKNSSRRGYDRSMAEVEDN